FPLLRRRAEVVREQSIELLRRLAAENLTLGPRRIDRRIELYGSPQPPRPLAHHRHQVRSGHVREEGDALPREESLPEELDLDQLLVSAPHPACAGVPVDVEDERAPSLHPTDRLQPHPRIL